MLTLNTVPELRSTLDAWRGRGERVALVPTLGNLHRGHESLMEMAREAAERVLVSIFVNPTQFGLGEDYQNYPRTMETDLQRLERAGVDLLFAPPVGEVYPNGHEHSTHVEVPWLSGTLCGAARPGHFRGVATVVCKLFNMVRPDLAVFGEKDWQQLLVIRHMVSDLALSVEIVGARTVREPDGLAASSRNAYMTPEERVVAPTLYRVLMDAARRAAEGERDYRAVEREAVEALAQAGFRPDYVAVRRAADLLEPEDRASPAELRILGAAWLGRARLIDNVAVV